MRGKTKQQLLDENEELKDRIEKLERSLLPTPEGETAWTQESARTIMDQAAEIAERKQMVEALRRSEQRLRLLSDTANQLLHSTSPQELANELCTKVMRHLDCQAFLNFLVDEKAGRLHLNAHAGVPADVARTIEWLDYGVAVCGCAARDARRIVAEDILHTPDKRTDMVRSFGIQAYACHPLFSQGRVIGTLSFGTRERTSFTDEELDLMKTVADQVAIAMERVRIVEREQRRSEELEARVRERTVYLQEANRALIERSRELEAFFAHSITPLVLLDTHFNFLRVNRAYAEACQKEIADFPGRNHFEFYPHEENQAIFERVVESKTSFQAVAKPFSFPDHPEWGITYWDWSLAPVLDEQGEVDFLVFSLNDVTQRYRAEASVRQNEELLRMVLETLPVGVWVADKNGQLALANPAGREIWGDVEPVGIAMHELFQGRWPDTGRRIENHEWGLARAVMNGETSIDEEIEMEASDGTRKRILTSSVPVLDPRGEIAGGVAVVEDITKRWEIERRDSATTALLALFARKSSRKEYLDAVVALIAEWSGCRCVGIRVTKGKRIPYESHVGFTQEFLDLEGQLSMERDQCSCVRVMAHAPEPQDLPAMTPGGSFRCDNTSRFVAQLSAEEQRRLRGACVRSGFLSVAIAPFRFGGQTLGAIHLADEREGRVPLKTVEFIEFIAPLVGEAVHRFTIEQELRENDRLQRSIDSLLRLTLRETPSGELPRRALDIISASRVAGFEPGCGLFLIGDNGTHLCLAEMNGHSESVAKQCERIPLGQCICGLAAQTREIQVCEADGRCSVPLIRENVLHGVLHMHLEAGQTLDRRKREMLLTLADVVASLLEHRRAEESLRGSERQLRNLSQQLLAAHEDERRSVASEIHDSVGQILSAIKFRVEGTLRLKGKARTRGLMDLVPIIKECIDEVRRIQMALRPSVLDDLGILSTINWFCRNFQTTYTAVAVERDIEIEEEDVPESLKIVIFRIMQEAFNNAAKHSGASAVRISLRGTDGTIALSIQDNGQGFDLQDRTPREGERGGLGLTSMRERVELSGGRWEIQSGLGSGTLIRAVWPARTP
jgi:PAS domain S-box-containing protein